MTDIRRRQLGGPFLALLRHPETGQGWPLSAGKRKLAGLLSVPIYEFTVYEFEDLPNRDYPSGDDRHRLGSSY
jgi:hypothetical protein